MVVAALGLALGFLLSVPPTGPVALLVLRHLLRQAPARAARMGLGTAVADIPYAALGAFGYDALVRGRPVVGAVLDASAAVLLLGVAVHLLRTDVEPPLDASPRRFGGDAGAGFVLGMLNPTRLLTWGLAASVAASATGEVHPLLWGVAVGVGGAAWWLALTVLWRRFGPHALDWRRRLLHASAVLAVVVAVGLVVRVARTWGDPTG